MLGTEYLDILTNMAYRAANYGGLGGKNYDENLEAILYQRLVDVSIVIQSLERMR